MFRLSLNILPVGGQARLHSSVEGEPRHESPRPGGAHGSSGGPSWGFLRGHTPRGAPGPRQTAADTSGDAA
eukprot:1813762-Pyramimonas_sp.AAC.1